MEFIMEYFVQYQQATIVIITAIVLGAYLFKQNHKGYGGN